jgi:hypothetical protein
MKIANFARNGELWVAIGAIVAIGTVGAPQRVFATTIYSTTSIADMTLFGGGDANSNNGQSTNLAAGSLSAAANRALLRFDLTALETAVTPGYTLDVQSVKLNFFTSGSSAAVTLGVYEIAQSNIAWSEGTRTTLGSATPVSSSTWNNRVNSPATAWTGGVGLGDFGDGGYGSALATVTGPTTSTNGTQITFAFTGTSAALTSLIDGWLTYGGDEINLLVRRTTSDGAGNVRAIVASSQHTTSTWHPALEIEYNLVPVPEPGTFAMLLFGGAMLWAVGRKRR